MHSCFRRYVPLVLAEHPCTACKLPFKMCVAASYVAMVAKTQGPAGATIVPARWFPLIVHTASSTAGGVWIVRFPPIAARYWPTSRVASTFGMLLVLIVPLY